VGAPEEFDDASLDVVGVVAERARQCDEVASAQGDRVTGLGVSHTLEEVCVLREHVVVHVDLERRDVGTGDDLVRADAERDTCRELRGEGCSVAFGERGDHASRHGRVAAFVASQLGRCSADPACDLASGERTVLTGTLEEGAQARGSEIVEQEGDNILGRFGHFAGRGHTCTFGRRADVLKALLPQPDPPIAP